MTVRMMVDTRDFDALSSEEQARTITVSIQDLQAAIERHVLHAPQALQTIEDCMVRVDQLQQRLQDIYEQHHAGIGSSQAAPGAARRGRVDLRSPRLAASGRAADFTMEVAEVAPDAGL